MIQANNKDLTLKFSGKEWIFRYVPAGEFIMGCNNGLAIETPAHKVSIGQEFFMSQFPVSQALWQYVMGHNPSHFCQSENNPVENISWLDCILFCEKFKDIFGMSARLPSESEWEYACRANSDSNYFFGENERSLRDYAWYDINSRDETHPVGLKLANTWGLFDMAGNVWEWCADDWLDDYRQGPLTSAAISLPQPSPATKKVLRGGACNLDSYRCRSSYRSYEQADYREKTFGFRVVLDLDAVSR